LFPFLIWGFTETAFRCHLQQFWFCWPSAWVHSRLLTVKTPEKLRTDSVTLAR